MLDSLLQLILQLPVGLLFAALLTEGFVLWKDRRDVEPAVLWLLCCATAVGLVCGALHGFLRGSADYALWVALASGLAALAFWFKRQMRNRGMLRLKDRYYTPGSYVPIKIPGQTAFILGFRGSVIGALALALLGLHFGGILNGSGLNASPKLSELTGAGKPSGDVANVAANSGGNTVAPPAAGATPGTPAAPAVAGTNPPAAAPGTPTVPSVASAEVPAASPAANPNTNPANPPPGDPATPAANPATAQANPATPPATPGAENPAAAPGTPAMPATPGAEANPPATPAIVPEVRPISKNSGFAKFIMPILSSKCVKCHGPQKQKGDCRLDSPGFIRGEGGGKAMVYAGKPDKSPLFMVISKPADDDDRMPPAKEGPPLSAREIELIKKWIESGADMGDGVSAASSGPGKFKTDELAAKLQPPPKELIDTLKGEGVVIRNITKDGKVLDLNFSHTDYRAGELKLDRLAPIALNVHVLDLSRTKVSDDDLVHVGAMANLEQLVLSRTELITDAGLAHFKNLAHLEYLNLYQTKVTDAGLSNLAGLTRLKKLYTWQSMVTEGGASSLAAKIPGLAVNTGQ